MRKKTFAMAAVLAAACLTLSACGSGADSDKPVTVVSEDNSQQAATVLDKPFEKPDLVLTDTRGKKYDLREQTAGKPTLIYFGYTHCPDVCPMTLATLHRVLGSIGPAADDARVLMVTVDPERDRPDTLARYVRRYGDAVHGLTGDPAEISRLAAAYGVGVEPGPDDGAHGSMMHTSAIFGIDRDGRLRVLLRPDSPDAELTEDVRTLLRG